MSRRLDDSWLWEMYTIGNRALAQRRQCPAHLEVVHDGDVPTSLAQCCRRRVGKPGATILGHAWPAADELSTGRGRRVHFHRRHSTPEVDSSRRRRINPECDDVDSGTGDGVGEPGAVPGGPRDVDTVRHR